MSPLSPDAPVTTIEDKALDKESVIELLGEDEQEQETLELDGSPKKDAKTKDKDSEPKEKDTKDDSESTDEEKEKELSLEEELEKELEEPDEDKLDLIEPPRRKEIIAKYPSIFKDFPQLERALYREQAYSKLLPTIEDAKRATERAEILDSYEKEIYNGSTETLLSSVRDNDKEAFAKVVDNYLPTLFKVDQTAYYHTLGNIVKHTITSMVRDSKEQNDEDLGQAAAILNMYMFGTKTFTPPRNLSTDTQKSDDDKKKEDSVTEKERALVKRQYETAHADLGGKIDNILQASIDKAIDPNEVMTDYVKKVAVKQVKDELDRIFAKETRFKGIYDKLWERAFDNNFDKASMDTIKSAYLSKAKTLLPDIIRRVRSEALKGIRRTDSKERDKRGPLPVGKQRTSTSLASGKSNNNSGAKTVPRGMSTLDYLNSED